MTLVRRFSPVRPEAPRVFWTGIVPWKLREMIRAAITLTESQFLAILAAFGGRISIIEGHGPVASSKSIFRELKIAMPFIPPSDRERAVARGLYRFAKYFYACRCFPRTNCPIRVSETDLRCEFNNQRFSSYYLQMLEDEFNIRAFHDVPLEIYPMGEIFWRLEFEGDLSMLALKIRAYENDEWFLKPDHAMRWLKDGQQQAEDTVLEFEEC